MSDLIELSNEIKLNEAKEQAELILRKKGAKNCAYVNFNIIGNYIASDEFQNNNKKYGTLELTIGGEDLLLTYTDKGEGNYLYNLITL